MLKSLVDGARRALVVVAHPDDETLGATFLMARARAVRILYLTDGSPRDASFRGVGLSREVYRAERRKELRLALSQIGVADRDTVWVDAPDQEAALHMAEIAELIAAEIRSFAPTVLVTHAYEGGHPDHDAAAFSSFMASCLLAQRREHAPPRVEMALYHGEDGVLHAGSFLPSRRAPAEHVLEPRLDELVIKRSMLRCFETQAQTLSPFLALSSERYRWAPGYDFGRPPHPGTLLYESWGFPIHGARFCELAHEAAQKLMLRARAQ